MVAHMYNLRSHGLRQGDGYEFTSTLAHSVKSIRLAMATPGSILPLSP